MWFSFMSQIWWPMRRYAVGRTASCTLRLHAKRQPRVVASTQTRPTATRGATGSWMGGESGGPSAPIRYDHDG